MTQKKQKLPPKYQAWVDARKRYKLSHAHIQMAREIGLNPKKFGGLANKRQEPWKAPLPTFIEELYFERFGRELPENVRSIEKMLEGRKKKKATKRLAKQGREDQPEKADTTDEDPF